MKKKKVSYKITHRARFHLCRKKENALSICICLCMYLKSLEECIGNTDMITSLGRWDGTGYIEDRDRKQTLMYIYLFKFEFYKCIIYLQD